LLYNGNSSLLVQSSARWIETVERIVKPDTAMTTKRRFARFYVPLLALTLILLYSVLPNLQPSTAEMMPAAIRFEATGSISAEDVAAVRDVLEERLSSDLHGGETGFALTREGNQLVVSLPSDLEPSVVVAEATRVGQVELVDGGTQFLSLDSHVKTGPYPIPDQDVYQAVLTSTDFEATRALIGDKGGPVIDFVLTPAGDARLAAHTAQLRGYYLCLAVDGRVVNCPILRTPLTDRRGTIELTGDTTLDEARTLARLLRSGPLPISLRLSSN
jgi:hypothetical protein